MQIEEILKKLERFEGRFPTAAVAQAIKRREEIAPRLLGILESLAGDPAPYLEEDERCDYLFALYLLAKFRDIRAYPLVLRICRLPDDTADVLLGDVITQDLGSILASVAGGDEAGLKALVEDPGIDEWIRDAALSALVTGVATGERSRGEVMAYLARLFETLPREEGHIWASLAHSALDLCPIEVKQQVLAAIEQDLIDPFEISPEDIEEALRKGIDAAIEDLPRHGHRLIDDLELDMGWLDGFQEDGAPYEPVALHENPYEDAEDLYDPFAPELEFPETYQREGPKIGRNEQCPCGSGRKYKKCCGR